MECKNTLIRNMKIWGRHPYAVIQMTDARLGHHLDTRRKHLPISLLGKLFEDPITSELVQISVG